MVVIVCAVIALVEYLTSDDAGKPLAGRFAWPVGLVISSLAADKGNGVVDRAVVNGKKVV
jgi:hypothetical protein